MTSSNLSKLEQLQELPEIMYSSLIPMLGQNNSRTIRLKEIFSHRNLTILIDGGSMHNFIQEIILKFLGFKITSSQFM